MFQCKDLLNLATFSSAKIIAGRQGLSNSIRWAYKVEEMEFGKWVKGGELLVVSNGIAKYQEFSLYEIVKTAIKHHMAGALLLIGKGYVEDITAQIITLANRYSFPIFTMRWDAIPLVELFEDLGHAIAYQNNLESQKDDILANIIFGNCNKSKEQLFYSKIIDYGISPPFQVFSIYFFKDNEESDDRIKNIKEVWDSFQVSVLLTKYGSNYIGLLHAKENDADAKKWEDFKDRFMNLIKTEDRERSFLIGVGQTYRELKQIQRSFQEATKCITLSHKLKKTDHISFYNQLGFYNLILHINDERVLKDYCKQILGTLIEYDKENNTELMKTLKQLIEANGNILETSKLLYMHRNTIKYRIQRIEELTGKSINESVDRTCFQTALMIMDYINEDM